MTVIPVIMCGGGGSRLWPASGAQRPKQFLRLLGPMSSFQEAAIRAAALPELGEILVVAGHGHYGHIRSQLAEVGLKATVLLEPEGRDSSAAIAAAVSLIRRRHADGVAVVMSADHHLPDIEAFAAAIAETLPVARSGAIVTLGVRPSAPTTAYGYIRPEASEASVKPVAAFVEKPDAERARTYVAEGFLWNSGYFVAQADTLAAELETFAPDVFRAADQAVRNGETEGDVLRLGEAFRAAPKISIDYAVMERTGRAAVLPVDFEWSDLGAWDSIWTAARKDGQGNVLPASAQAISSRDNLVMAPGGVHVALLGVEGLGVIVERDAVLVCDLAQSQTVRTIAGGAPPQASAQRFSELGEAASWYDLWLRTAGLPLWATAGVDPDSGAFREALALDGRPSEQLRRARVQSRQVFVYATAAAAGIEGPWLAAAERGFDNYVHRYRRDDGLFAYAVDLHGRPADTRAFLYEQAFSLLAMAALHGCGRDLATDAGRLQEALRAYRHDHGGFREIGEHPYQANALMHLLEAALAWEELGTDSSWKALADELVELARTSFIDARGGFLREFFDESWRPASGEDGRWVEPGHQFEWAWLLERWGRARGDDAARAQARVLFTRGLRGVDRTRGVAVDRLWDDLSIRDAGARLWPQTEYLKAALWLGEHEEALAAARGLARYLDVPARGAWRDKLRPDASFVDEAAPASSFYHILGAVMPLVGFADAR